LELAAHKFSVKKKGKKKNVTWSFE